MRIEQIRFWKAGALLIHVKHDSSFMLSNPNEHFGVAYEETVERYH